MTRRDFMTAAGGLVASAALPSFGQGKAARRLDASLVALISDLHVNGLKAEFPAHCYEEVCLRKTVADILSLDPLPANVVCFGDIAYHWGQPEDYPLAASILKPLVDAGIRLTLGMGNHDRRDNYDRVLTTDELVRNRNVDSARYFGALATTNVFVVAGGEGAVQAETGAYKVEGSWEFTATKTVNKKGDVVDVTRYAVSEFKDGEWKKQTYSGNSYTYTEGTSPATVRLEWLPDPMGMVIILK